MSDFAWIVGGFVAALFLCVVCDMWATYQKRKVEEARFTTEARKKDSPRE